MDVGSIGGFTKPVMSRFREETGTEDPAEYFDFDFRIFSLRSRYGGDDPGAFHGQLPPATTFDDWGVGHLISGTDGTVDKTYPPLAGAETVKDIASLPSPLVNETLDLSPIKEYHNRGYPVFGYSGSVYEWSWWLRGMDNFMMDMLLRPALAQAIVKKVAAYTKTLVLASARAGIDVLCFYDDAGMQSGMQISPELWKKFIKPAWRGILEAARGEERHPATFLHSCGNVREILPDILDLGFDILHPIQPECMDVEQVKRDFGKDIVVCATLSSQKVFPFGSPQDVRREVRRLKSICGSDRRCILCPSNLIQPETPWENILAFADEARAS